MAATARQSAVAGEMTAEEQAQLDQMRVDDNAPIDDGGEQRPVDQGQQQADEGTPAEGAGGEAAQQQQQRQQMVPHAALHEERTRRQEAEKRVAAVEERERLLQERTNLLLQQRLGQQPQPQGQQQAPQLPNFETHPAEHLVARLAQNEALMGQVVQALATQNQRTVATDQATQLRQRTNALENEFASRTPDYQQAASYLLAARHRELEAVGWADPAERQTILTREAEGLAARAAQLARNPGEMVYELAKQRGYAAPAPANEAQNGTGSSATPTGEQQIRTIERGQQQARSVGQLRGNAPTPLTAQRLIEMSDAEFSRVMETPEGRELLGS